MEHLSGFVRFVMLKTSDLMRVDSGKYKIQSPMHVTNYFNIFSLLSFILFLIYLICGLYILLRSIDWVTQSHLKSQHLYT